MNILETLMKRSYPLNRDSNVKYRMCYCRSGLLLSAEKDECILKSNFTFLPMYTLTTCT